MIVLVVKRILSHKLRTILNILSVLIGAGFLLFVLGLSNGIEEKFISTLNKLSSNIVIVVPLKINNVLFLQREIRTGVAMELFKENLLNKIKLLPGIKAVSPTIQLTLKVNNKSYQVTGIETKLAPQIILSNIELERGRIYRSKKEVILGPIVAEDLDVKVGDSINIEGKTVKVVGILKRAGTSLLNSDNVIFGDYDFVKSFGHLPPKRIAAIVAISENASLAAQEILKLLDRAYGITKEDDRWYSVITSESISKQLSQMLFIVKAFFIAISLVSVLVSLIVISNNAYMNVADKYREIATLKVLGMRNKDVILLTIAEALVLSLTGLILAIVFVLIGASFMSLLKITISDIVIITLFTIIGTVLASYFPARHAAKIEPAEALRYE